MELLKPDHAPVGLPHFALRPPPVSQAQLWSSGPASSLSSEGAQHSLLSIDTQPFTLEEELSRELTMELLEDFALEEGRSGRGSAHPSRKPSSCLTTSEGAAACGTASEGQQAAAGQQQWQEEDAGSDEQAPSPEALQPSLYEQLGGGVAVKAVLDCFYRRVMDDPQLGRFFDGLDKSKHTRKVLLFVTYVLGGPDDYLQLNPEPWPALYTLHEELMRKHGLRERHFDLVKQRFGEAMQDAGASRRLIDLALGVVETIRSILFPAGGAHEEEAAANLEPSSANTAAQTDACPAASPT